MSQENVEIVRRLYDGIPNLREAVAQGRDPFAKGSPWIDEGIEWRGPREFPDLAEPHHGHEGVRSYFEKLFEAIEDYTMSPEEFIDVGDDRVLVFSREGGRGRGSGAEIQTHPTAHLWTIRDGKAIRMRSYWERSDALEAAGLSE